MELTAEQRMVVESVQELARAEFADRAGQWEGTFPFENLRVLADRGYLGVNFAERYGGGGMTEFEAMLVTEAVSRVCPDTGLALNTLQLIGPRTVEKFGSEAVKERYLPDVLAGESMVAIAISEPGAGSDVRAMNTRVEERDGERFLDGEKTWVSDVPESDAAVVWAKFPEGLGSVVVDLDDPGVEIQNHYTNMAGHTQTHFVMEDVPVPAENVLTRGPEAFRAQLESLNWERLGNAAMTCGMSAFAIDRALDYAKQREQFGQPIADFQGIEWKLADMVKRYEAAQALTHRAAERAMARDGVPDRLDTSVANLFSAEVTDDIVSEALQIHGANGYQRGHPIEYLYRLVRGWRIGAGTDEIQKNQIAAAVKRQGLGPTV